MTLADRCYTQIRQDIVTGTLPPGEPLKMDLLKEKYGVGFSPLREALNRLQSDRLVTLASARGFRVSPISLAEMWDTVHTRILIETDALKRSMRLGDDKWEVGIVSSLHALTLQASRVAAFGRAPSNEEVLALEERHSAFHKALISGCQSQWTLSFAEKLYVDTERYRFPVLMNQGIPHERNLNEEHTRLADAVTARDEKTAVELLKNHLMKTGDTLEKNFDTIFKPAALASSA